MLTAICSFLCRPILPENTSNVFERSFYDLYEIIYRFHRSIVNVLVHNRLTTLADSLGNAKQLSINDKHVTTSTFTDNAEHVLKDVMKVIQTSMAIHLSTINEYEVKQKTNWKQSLFVEQTTPVDGQSSSFIEEQQATIDDLTTKYKTIVDILDRTTKEHEEETRYIRRIK
jgi:hypothetical protein